MSSAEQPRLPQSSIGYRIVTVGFGILLAALMLVFVIQQWKQTYHLVKPVKDYTDYLGTHEMKTTEPKADDKSVAQSDCSVFEIDVDGKPLWVCYFDIADKKQADALAALQGKPSLKINGEEHPFKVHGSIVIVGYDKHPDQEKLLKALDEYDAPKK